MPSAEVRRARPPFGSACALVVAAACVVGCKSDLSQQLLERELRYQEDQIYHLQDELAAACARLEHASGENASLRRQLGVGDDATPRSAPARPRGPLSAPVPVPPAVQLPETLAPPALEGVPPLPTEPTPAPGASPAPPASAPPAATAPTPADPEGLSLPVALPPGAVRQLSFTEPADDEPVTHLVVNRAQTVCIDADGDGTSEGITVVVEPRDAGDRLVAAPGAISIAVFDAAAGIDPATAEAAPIARWDIPAAAAATRFRRTSRQRGLHFELPWQGRPPAGGHVKVAVRLTPPDGQPLDADATIAVRRRAGVARAATPWARDVPGLPMPPRPDVRCGHPCPPLTRCCPRSAILAALGQQRRLDDTGNPSRLHLQGGSSAWARDEDRELTGASPESERTRTGPQPSGPCAAVRPAPGPASAR